VHLFDDTLLQMWIKNHSGTMEDESFYTTNVRQLLTSEDHDAYHSLLNDFTQRWSPPFLEYYNRSLGQAVQTYALFAMRIPLSLRVVYDAVSA